MSPGLRWLTSETAVGDRPPLVDVLEYADRLVLGSELGRGGC